MNEFRLEQMIGTMKQVMDGGGEFRFYPKGTSMLPLIRQGKDAIALIKAPEKLKKYDIPLYVRQGGNYVLHRVIGEDENGYIMCGDNQTAKEPGISHGQIQGVVTAIFRKDKRVNTDSFGFRLYSRIWCFMPLRRLYFFCRRAAGKLKRLIFAKK